MVTLKLDSIYDIHGIVPKAISNYVNCATDSSLTVEGRTPLLPTLHDNTVFFGNICFPPAILREHVPCKALVSPNGLTVFRYPARTKSHGGGGGGRQRGRGSKHVNVPSSRRQVSHRYQSAWCRLFFLEGHNICIAMVSMTHISHWKYV